MTAVAHSTHVHRVLDSAVVEDPEAGVYRANRRIFTDEEVFELEMKHIFEGNWIYLAHESQVPEKGDYFTTYMGRQPVVITRGQDGELNLLINACAHRGAMIEATERAFAQITGGRWPRLDIQPQGTTERLIGIRGGEPVAVGAMSTGTQGQLYLALRIAGHAQFAAALQSVVDQNGLGPPGS